MTFGGGGLFVVTFFDSSVLSFPFFPDAVLIELCIANHARMPYYAAMAAFGSLLGSMVLYFLAKKGGEAFFHKHAGGKAEKIKQWVDNNGFLSAFLPALLPPPFPFKPFVLAEESFKSRRALLSLPFSSAAPCATAAREFSPCATAMPPSFTLNPTAAPSC